MKTLYFDCFAGISGDMTIGALLDLGLDFHFLESELKKLALPGYQLSLRRVTRSQLAATKFDVTLTENHDDHSHSHDHHDHDHSHDHHDHDHSHDHHDHDHTHSHDHHHNHSHDHTHSHDHHHNHSHDHSHSHDHDHHHDHSHDPHHEHRNLPTINKLIDESNLSAWVKETAKKIFYRLAVAEGKIHGISPEQVHFHEVGAIDAIVDIVGACIGFEKLEVEKFICSSLHVGRGFVNCAHGKFPIPAPATAEMLQGIPIYSTEIEKEMVTPTGAAIVSTLCSEFIPLPKMAIEKIGYGAGGRDIANFPNVLRLFYGELAQENKVTHSRVSPEPSSANLETITIIEANIDDMNPQIYGYLMDKLLKQGALDVFYTPIYMKKNRPGVLLTILVEKNNFENISAILFQETTTLGIRYYETNRRTLARHKSQVQTVYGEVEVKFAFLGEKIINVMPEYDSCASVAQKANVPLTLVQTAATLAFEKEKDTLQQQLYKG